MAALLVILVILAELYCGFTIQCLQYIFPSPFLSYDLWRNAQWIGVFTSKLMFSLTALYMMYVSDKQKKTFSFLWAKAIWISVIIPEVLIDLYQEFKGTNIYIEKYELPSLAASLIITTVAVIISKRKTNLA